MSRGPGKWQRLILQKLREEPAVWQRDLLPANYSAAEYQALYRASRRLFEVGAVDIWTSGLSHSAIVLARPGHKPTNLCSGQLKDDPEIIGAVLEGIRTV